MENNDILIRLRYALDIKNTDMVKIFKLGGIELSKEDVLKVLTKSDDYYNETDNDDIIICNNKMLDSFLNGFITFKRGPQENTPNKSANHAIPTIKSNSHVNNVLFKKLKIALKLTSDDMLDLLDLAGVTVSKGELSAILRKDGHKHYVECGDKFARNLIKGLTIKHRE